LCVYRLLLFIMLCFVRYCSNNNHRVRKYDELTHTHTDEHRYISMTTDPVWHAFRIDVRV